MARTPKAPTGTVGQFKELTSLPTPEVVRNLRRERWFAVKCSEPVTLESSCTAGRRLWARVQPPHQLV